MARVEPLFLRPAIRLASPLAVAVAAIFATGSLGCGGPQIPKGDGYRAKDRQGCLWEGFHPGQPEPFCYASSRQDVLDELRRTAPAQPARG